jgi:hypothetical protein
MCLKIQLRTHLPFTEKHTYTRLPSTPITTVTARNTPTIRHLDKFLAAFTEHLHTQAELWNAYYTLLNQPLNSSSSLSLCSSHMDYLPTYYEATHPSAIYTSPADFDKRTAVLQSLSADMVYEMHQFYNDWSSFLDADIAGIARDIRREMGWSWWNVVKRRRVRKALWNTSRAWEKEEVVVGRAMELFS